MTTVALPKVPAGNEVGTLNSIASLLTAVGGMSGSGKSTTTSSMDPGVAGMMQQLMQSIGATSNGDAIDSTIQDIFNRAKPAIGMPAFQTAGAGAYNSTARAQMATAPLAAAVAASGKVKLDAQQQGQDMMSRLLAAQAGANRTTTTQTGASPIGKLLGPAALGLFAYNKLRGPQGKKGGTKVPGTTGALPGKDGDVGLPADDGTTPGIQAEIDKLGGDLGTSVADDGLTDGISEVIKNLGSGGGSDAFTSLALSNPEVFADSNFFGNAAGLFDGGGEALADASSWVNGFDLASGGLDIASTGADVAGFGLEGLGDLWFPGAGTLLSSLLQGGDPFENLGNSISGIMDTVGGFFDDLFDW